MTAMSVDIGIMAAEHAHMVVTLLSGAAAKPMYDAYRKRAREHAGWLVRIVPLMPRSSASAARTKSAWHEPHVL